MGIGKVEEWTGDMQAAKRTYEKVLKIEPGHTGAQSRLSALLWVR
jgi:predicted TPR repeat methyltransferase